MKLKSQFFRANVGIVVINDRGEVLAFERIDSPDSWQLPQGGLDLDEEPWNAALRELEEETGIPPDAVELLAEHPDWIAYELPVERRLPALGRGQVQKWFLVKWLNASQPLDPLGVRKPEFRAWKWIRLEELAEQVVEFRRPVYRRLLRAFSHRMV